MKRTIIMLLLGLAVGAGLGLYIGWVVAPTELTDVSPAALDETAQQDYLQLVAAAYWRDDNLAAARQRLGSLGRTDLLDWLRATAVDAILRGEEEPKIRQLVYLASSLGLDSPAFAPYVPAKPAEVAP